MKNASMNSCFQKEQSTFSLAGKRRQRQARSAAPSTRRLEAIPSHQIGAEPHGLALYGACLIGEAPIAVTVKPMLGYLGLLLACLRVIAFVPGLTTWLPRMLGYQ
jgi:hypothetical protein